MTRVGAYEAKTHLPGLLERVANGERFTITKHGVPVAMLIPATAAPVIDRMAAIEGLRAFRRGRTRGSRSVRTMMEEGRRH